MGEGTYSANSIYFLRNANSGADPADYHYISSRDWSNEAAFGVPNRMLACVNPQSEPGFTFPDGVNSKYALKFFVQPVKPVYFPQSYYPEDEDFWNEHIIAGRQWFDLQLNKTCRIHFWVKADGNVSDFRYRLIAGDNSSSGFHGYDVINPVNVGPTWTEATSEIKIVNPDDPATTSWHYGIEFRFTGQTTFYIDDVQIQEKL
jgi:hypothetical protein